MPLDYLRVLASKPLPFTVSDEADVDKVRVLKAAGCIETHPIDEHELATIVTAITHTGHTQLTSEGP